MRVGTKTVLWGYHAFWLHGFFVLRAWWLLFGAPNKAQRFAIFLHDIGYLGSPNIDGRVGRMHPVKTITLLFPWSRLFRIFNDQEFIAEVLYHSRRVALLRETKPSDLCAADKLAFLLYPRWLLWLLYNLSGEYREYKARFLHGTLQKQRGYTGKQGADHERQIWKDWYNWAASNNVDYLKGVDVWQKLPNEIQMKILNKLPTN